MRTVRKNTMRWARNTRISPIRGCLFIFPNIKLHRFIHGRGISRSSVVGWVVTAVLLSSMATTARADKVNIKIECDDLTDAAGLRKDKYTITIKTTYYDSNKKVIPPPVKVGDAEKDPKFMRAEIVVTPNEARTVERKLLVCPMINCAFKVAGVYNHPTSQLEDSKFTVANPTCDKCPLGSGMTCGGDGKFQRKHLASRQQDPSYRFECIELTFPKDKKDPQKGYAKGDGSTADAKGHLEDMTKIVGAHPNPPGVDDEAKEKERKKRRQQSASSIVWYVDFLCNQHDTMFEISCVTRSGETCCRVPSGSGKENKLAPVGPRLWWLPAEAPGGPWDYKEDGRFTWSQLTLLAVPSQQDEHVLLPYNAITTNPEGVLVTAHYLIDRAGVPIDWVVSTFPTEGEFFTIDPGSFREDSLFVLPPETIAPDTIVTVVVSVIDTDGDIVVTNYFDKAFDQNGPEVLDLSDTLMSPSDVLFQVTAQDIGAGVNSATLAFNVDGGPMQHAPLNYVSGDYRGPTTFTTTLGPFPAGALISYHVDAMDDVGNITTSALNSLTVPSAGACCLTNDTCQSITELSCAAFGGSFGGIGSACKGLVACCFTDGTCQNLDPLCCVANGGRAAVWGSVCLGDNNGNGIDDACEEVIPAVSNVGLAALLLLTAVAGVIVIRRSRRGHAAA